MSINLDVPLYWHYESPIDVEGEFAEDPPSLPEGSQKMLTGGDTTNA